jgi:AcrR family transcriptional regulator
METRRDGRSTTTGARLQEEAARLFWRNGYAATSTRELADALGVQKASLYHHMDSKEQLLYGLCIDALRHIESAVQTAIAFEDDPLERLRALIRAHVGAMLHDKNKHATMLTEMRALSAERRDDVLAMRDRYQRLVLDVLSSAQEAGALRQDIAAELLSLGLLDLLNWAIFWFREDDALGAEELADTFSQMFLEGAARPTVLGPATPR